MTYTEKEIRQAHIKVKKAIRWKDANALQDLIDEGHLKPIPKDVAKALRHSTCNPVWSECKRCFIKDRIEEYRYRLWFKTLERLGLREKIEEKEVDLT